MGFGKRPRHDWSKAGSAPGPYIREDRAPDDKIKYLLLWHSTKMGALLITEELVTAGQIGCTRRYIK